MIYLVDSESLTKYSPDDNNDLSKSKLRKSERLMKIAKARTVSENKKVANIRAVCTGNDSRSLWLP